MLAYEIIKHTKKSLFEWFKNTKKYFLENEFYLKFILTIQKMKLLKE